MCRSSHLDYGDSSAVRSEPGRFNASMTSKFAKKQQAARDRTPSAFHALGSLSILILVFTSSCICSRASRVMQAKKAGDWPMKRPISIRNLSAPMATPCVFVGRMIEKGGRFRLDAAGKTLPDSNRESRRHNTHGRVRYRTWRCASPTFLGQDAFPKILDPHPNASDWTDPGNDCAPSVHAARFSFFASRYRMTVSNFAASRRESNPAALPPSEAFARF